MEQGIKEETIFSWAISQLKFNNKTFREQLLIFVPCRGQSKSVQLKLQ
jgi:hypothetical protein